MYSSTLQAPILLIGAAHVVDLERPLRATFAERPLDAVAVELDDQRAQALLAPESIATGGRSGAPVFLRLWALVQRRLGAEIGGGLPGAEMKVAVMVARERGLPVLLIDDPIRETLARLIRSMSLRERLGLVVGGLVGLIVPTRFVEHQLEAYNEAPGDTLGAIRTAYPGVARVLLDDRNEHMADRLAAARQRGFGRIAAVIGDAHVPGLADALKRRGVPVETIPFAALRSVRGP